MYNDKYETCSETYVTLRVYFDDKTPNDITEYFGINPSNIQIKGEENKLRRNKSIKHNGWFLTSEGIISSKDTRRHIDYLTNILLPIKSKLKSLIDGGAKVDISCYWESESGQGGPTLSLKQLTELAELGIELWFDLY